MDVLFLPLYSSRGASSRVRFFQYFRFFSDNGINVHCSPLLDDDYLSMRYDGGFSFFKVLKLYFKRFLVIFSFFKYDLIVIEKEIFPFLPPFFEYFIYLFGVPYVVDYDDATFHNYDMSKSKIVRLFLGKKIDRVMKLSSYVCAGNSYLADRARFSGAQNVVVLPSVVDTARLNKNRPINKKKRVIGWIGSPSTQKYLTPILGVIDQVCSKYDAEFIIIGAKSQIFKSPYFSFYDWSLDTEAQSIEAMDIGIMPLDNGPWERGKCAYKLIQYMACGKPVVASPVGANLEVVISGFNGFLAYDENDWYELLSCLVCSSDDELEILGDRGRELVVSRFSVEAQRETFLGVIREACL